jgi:hypothetical protein
MELRQLRCSADAREVAAKVWDFPPAPDHEVEVQHPEQVPAWVHVVDRALQNLTESQNVRAWDILREAGWLSAGTAQRVSDPVWKKTRTLTHIKIGHLGWLGADLTDLVDDLVAGTGTDEDRTPQRARAFFIVRHTVPIFGSGPPPVSLDFYDVISELRADADLRQHLGKRYARELEQVAHRFRSARSGWRGQTEWGRWPPPCAPMTPVRN